MYVTKRPQRYHPSDVLHNDQATGPAHALQLVIDECEEEERISYLLDAGDGLYDGRQARAELCTLKEAARRCLAAYRARLAEAEQALFDAWSSSEDADVRHIGEALAAGDYSRLAI